MNLELSPPARRALLIALLLAAAPALHAQHDPLAGLDAGQRRVVEKFVGKQITENNTASANLVRVQDLDGDGQPEMVVLWTSYFGNSYASSLSVLAAGRAQQGRRLWHEAATVEILGSDPRLDIRGAALTVDSVTLAPGEARCCPTRKVRKLWVYRGGKLVAG